MAQLLGPDLLATDEELWRAGVPRLAAKLEANASAASLALIDRYLTGVNAAIADYRVLPPEFLLLASGCPRWAAAGRVRRGRADGLPVGQQYGQ